MLIFTLLRLLLAVLNLGELVLNFFLGVFYLVPCPSWFEELMAKLDTVALV